MSSITLEILGEEHVAILARLGNDRGVSRTSSVPYPCTPYEVQKWREKNNETPLCQLTFAILKDEEPVGCCVLKEKNGIERTAELAYWIGSSYQGLGITAQAAAMLCDIAFTNFDLDYLHAHCLKFNNPGSLRILEKIGFQPDTMKKDKDVDGRFAEDFPGDAWMYFILRREWWSAL